MSYQPPPLLYFPRQVIKAIGEYTENILFFHSANQIINYTIFIFFRASYFF